MELWSGTGTIVAAARKRGLKAMPFDVDRDPPTTRHTEDITSPLHRLRLLLRVVTWLGAVRATAGSQRVTQAGLASPSHWPTHFACG